MGDCWNFIKEFSEIIFETVEGFRGLNFFRYGIIKSWGFGVKGFGFYSGKVSLSRIVFRNFALHAESTGLVELEI